MSNLVRSIKIASTVGLTNGFNAAATGATGTGVFSGTAIPRRLNKLLIIVARMKLTPLEIAGTTTSRNTFRLTTVLLIILNEVGNSAGGDGIWVGAGLAGNEKK